MTWLARRSFVRASADAAHQRAVATQARIVHSAGFDSVPSDLGVWLLHDQVRADGAGTLEETVLVLVSARGGVSGGTVESARGVVEDMADPGAGAAFSPTRTRSAPTAVADPSGTGELDPLLPGRDPLLHRWVAALPFGPHNGRIVPDVRNALLGHVLRAPLPVPGAAGDRRRSRRSGSSRAW